MDPNLQASQFHEAACLCSNMEEPVVIAGLLEI